MPAVPFSSFFQSLGWAVLNSLWQFALLWVFYNLLIQVMPLKPVQRNRLGFGLLSVGFIWFLWTLITAATEPEGIARQNILYAVNSKAGIRFHALLTGLLPWLSVVYLITLTLPLIRFIRNFRFITFIKKQGLQKIDVEWRLFVQKMAAYTGIRKKVQVYISAFIQSPVTIGFLKPVILVPVSALANLTPPQLEALLLHELVHIRNRDFLFNIIARFIQTVLYFNPFTHLFIKVIEQERERSCDEMVLQYQYEPHSYASALLMLEKQKTALPVFALAAAGKNHDLLHRIEHIMNVRQHKSLRRLPALLAALALVVFSHFYFFSDTSNDQSHGSSKLPLAFNEVRMVKPVFDGQTADNSVPAELTIQAEAVDFRTPAPASALKKTAADPNRTNSSATASPFTEVAYIIENTAGLNEEQINRVKATVDATRRIVEEKEWKILEKQLADMVTQAEKQQLKQQLNAEMSRMNLARLETKLLSAYDKINWEKLGDKLSAGINEIRLDSLETVYASTLAGLEKAKTLTESDPIVPAPAGPSASGPRYKNLKPVIEEYKATLINNLDTLRNLRARKIVRL